MTKKINIPFSTPDISEKEIEETVMEKVVNKK